VKKSIEYLKSGVINYEFRTTITKELFTKDIAKNMAKWLAGARILYLQCFKDNETNLEKDLNKIESKDLTEYENILKTTIKEVKRRGY